MSRRNWRQIAAGRVPADADAMYFWYFTAVHAEDAGDTDLYARTIDGLRKQGRAFPASMVEKMEKVLAEMRGSKGGGGR